MPRSGIQDELFMMECLALAEQGVGSVSPNPMVGAVVVRGRKVIARGAHLRFGGPHAEVHALRAARRRARGATLYVNLEPCNIFGKTPPCTDLIITCGIARVVVGVIDPNPDVSGRGVKQLRRAGIRVDVGVLESECTKFNESFFKYAATRTPFVTLKLAQSIDGKIADAAGHSRWISSPESHAVVHALRARTDAVLVGAGTVRSDDPRLTVRAVPGRNPLRVILDGRFSVSPFARVFRRPGGPTLLFVSEESARRNPGKRRELLRRGVEIVALPGSPSHGLAVMDVLHILGSKNVASVLVEGGSRVFASFLNENAADKILAFVAPSLFGSGLDTFTGLRPRSAGHARRMKSVSARRIGDDILIEGYLH